MADVVVIEDDVMLNRGVCFALKKDGHNPLSAVSIKAGRNLIEQSNVDFLLLDINLPDGSGLDYCSEISESADFPIVLFTANDTEEDMVKGFECGCDDYIAKPFSLEVLKHKINALLRQRKSIVKDENIFIYKDMKIDYNKMSVLIEDEKIKLTTTEYKLLEALARNKGNVMTKELLLEKLWDSNESFVDENTLSVNIRRLRKKIEKDSRNPEYIITIFGTGYRFGE